MRVETNAAVGTPDTPKKLAKAATDFEALLLSQMLRSAREASTTTLDGSDSGSDDSVMDFAEQQLGTLMASAGGLGLGKLAVSGLARQSATAQKVQLK